MRYGSGRRALQYHPSLVVPLILVSRLSPVAPADELIFLGVGFLPQAVLLTRFIMYCHLCVRLDTSSTYTTL